MSASPETILVVEDDNDVRDAVCDVLREEGFGVAGVADGREALSYLRSRVAPLVIVLDLMMPRMDGTEFANELRNDPALADIPVILLSADPSVAEMMGKLGARAYLRKPVELERLLETIKRFHRP